MTSASSRFWRLLLAAAAALGLLLAAPRFLERGTLNDLWNLAFAVVLASSWNILGGFAGQVSIGYSAFIGIGAYTTVLLALGGVNPYATLPLAALLAAAFSFVVGLPTAVGGYAFLRDDELEPYRGGSLWLLRPLGRARWPTRPCPRRQWPTWR